ncbi:hypothetical protein ABIE49_000041 [Bradyrhizobium sp. OAE829]
MEGGFSVAGHDPNLNFENNLATLTVNDRRAQVNTLFAGLGMQPVRAVDPAIAAAPQAIVSSDWLTGAAAQSKADADTLAAWADVISNWRDRFDVVVDIHGACESAVAAPALKRVARSKIADVYIANRQH